MTKRTITTSLLLLSCVTTYAGAQAPGRDSAAEATIRALDDEERLAALNQDFAKLERLWSKRFIVNAPSNQILPNRSAVLDWFRKGMTTRSSYERSIEQVRVDGDIPTRVTARILPFTILMALAVAAAAAKREPSDLVIQVTAIAIVLLANVLFFWRSAHHLKDPRRTV